jgi:hypothetical protein
MFRITVETRHSFASRNSRQAAIKEHGNQTFGICEQEARSGGKRSRLSASRAQGEYL